MEPNECLWCGNERDETFKINEKEVIVDTKTNKQIKAVVCPSCWGKHHDTDIESDEVKSRLTSYARKFYGLTDPDWMAFRN